MLKERFSIINTYTKIIICLSAIAAFLFILLYTYKFKNDLLNNRVKFENKHSYIKTTDSQSDYFEMENIYTQEIKDTDHNIQKIYKILKTQNNLIKQQNNKIKIIQNKLSKLVKSDDNSKEKYKQDRKKPSYKNKNQYPAVKINPYTPHSIKKN